MTPLPYRIFSQTPEAALDPAAIVRTATRFFEAEIDVQSLQDPAVPSTLPDFGRSPVSSSGSELGASGEPSAFGAELVVTLESARRKLRGAFRIRARAATAADYDAAREAEIRGRAGGMGLLAARCPSVWEVTPEGIVTEGAILNLCAILASVALGPALPPDESTLFGVRGAMERLEAITGATLSR